MKYLQDILTNDVVLNDFKRLPMEDMKTRPLLITFGNPLLDLTIVVTDTSLHRKFDLPVDGQLEVTEEQKELFDIAMQRNDVTYTAGGCCLNTSRVFSWVLGEANKVTFVGGLGKDGRAKELCNILTDSGVITRYIESPTEPTGACVALVLGAQRCLCADIGAAAFCEPKDIFNSDIFASLEASPVVYVEGYFITHSFSTALKIAQYCQTAGKLFIFNLCGSYVCEHHSEELSQLLPYVDILFGYVEEYHSLHKFVNVNDLSKTHSHSKLNILHELNLTFDYCIEKEIFSGDENKEICSNVLNNENSSSICDGVGRRPSDREPSKSNENCLLEVGRDQECSEKCEVSEPTCIVPANCPPTLDSKCSNYQNVSTSFEDSILNTNSNTSIVDNKSNTKRNTGTSDAGSQSTGIPLVKSLNTSATNSNISTPTLGNQTTRSQSSDTPVVKKLNTSSSNTSNELTLAQNNCLLSQWKQRKLVVVTQGPLPLIYTTNHTVSERQVAAISIKDIIDTTGAGDSFVGGFLACLVKGRSLTTCLDGGMWSAQQLLKQKGCTIPSTPAVFLQRDSV